MEYYNNGCNICNNDTICENCEQGIINANKFFKCLINGPKKYKITLELDDNLVLQNKIINGITTNRKYWWIKKIMMNL